MALPANISTGRVAGQFIVGVADGADVDDEPDFIAASGTVAFTASTPYLPNPTASPNPVTMLKTTILAVLDSEGYICTPSPSDPTVAGKRGIRLVATDDPDASVEGWTWKATPQFLNVNGTVIHDAIRTFDFALPSGSTVDLTTVVKVPASQGIGTEQAEALAAAASASAQAAAADAAAVKDKALANDAGVAGFLTSGAKTTVALDSKVKESTTQQVPPLVAQAIAADGTVAAAAGAAVSAAIEGKSVALTTDPGMPSTADAEGRLVVFRDAAGRETWLGARTEDGGPTDWAMEHLQGRLGVSPSEVPGYLYAVTDSNRRMTDLAVRASDGQFPDYVINRLRPRIMAGYEPPTLPPAPSTDRVYADAPYSLDSDIFPVKTDMSRAAGWGSSSMEGVASKFIPLFAGLQTAYYHGGKGGETAEQTAARMGALPALVTVAGGAVPASGEVAVTTSNVSRTSNLRPFTGTLAGVPGTLSYRADPASYIFTRSSPGAVMQVSDDTPFIPDGRIYRDALTLLWIGKNNLTSNTIAADTVVRITKECHDWLAPLQKRCLVLGHFVNSNTAANAGERTQILKANAALMARYGRTFIDVHAYITGGQVWADTGITPTAADLEEQQLGNKPPSLSQDVAHLNSAANTAITTLVSARLEELGWYKP